MINEMMTGDPDVAATAWNVPPIDVVQARAANSHAVEVVDYGDGSYFLRLKRGAIWDEECVNAFIHQEFASDCLDAIEWSLKTNSVTFDDLKKSETRVGELHLRHAAEIQEK